MMRHQETARRRVGARLLVLCCATLPAAFGRGETAQWNEPALDTWAYTNSVASGTREFGPTFGSFAIDPSTNLFFQGSDQGPTRLGTTLLAFETNDQIDSGIDPSRYVVNSITVNVWGTKSGNGDLLYSEQAQTPASLLAEALAGPISSQQPAELFGVGFTQGFTGFALGENSGGGATEFFGEATEPYLGADIGQQGPYVVYPVVGDGQGGYADVSNSYSGGFSVTAPGQSTGPFDATPWAIGDGFSVNTSDIDHPGTPYNEGDVLPLITRYEFSLDLAAPGVEQYIQEGLADGALGFFLSSLHRGGQPGVPGGGAYIDWRMKEAFADFSGRLAIDFSILPEQLTGDADGDSDVDGDDLIAVQTEFGGVGASPLLGDADGDGDVDGDDLIAVQTSFGATAAVAVPEPSAAGYTAIAAATVAFCWGTHFFTAPRGLRRDEW